MHGRTIDIAGYAVPLRRSAGETLRDVPPFRFTTAPSAVDRGSKEHIFAFDGGFEVPIIGFDLVNPVGVVADTWMRTIAHGIAAVWDHKDWIVGELLAMRASGRAAMRIVGRRTSSLAIRVIEPLPLSLSTFAGDRTRGAPLAFEAGCTFLEADLTVSAIVITVRSAGELFASIENFPFGRRALRREACPSATSIDCEGGALELQVASSPAENAAGRPRRLRSGLTTSSGTPRAVPAEICPF